MPPPSPPLTQMDMLGLFWRVDHSLGTLSRQMLLQLGVTSPQRLAMRVLAGDPSITAAALATILRVDRSSVTGILRRLEEAGCVARSTDVRDGRRRRIQLTEKGRGLDARQHGTVESAMTRTLADLTEPELATVTRFLTRFAAELEHEREVLRSDLEPDG